MPGSLPFTKVSIYQELWKVDTTHTSVLPLVSSCLLLGACTGLLSVSGSCSPPPPRPKPRPVHRHRGLSEVEGLCARSLFANDEPKLSFPNLVLGPDSLLPDSPSASFVNLNSLVGRTFALGHPGREQQFPYAIEEQSAHSWEMLHFSEEN